MNEREELLAKFQKAMPLVNELSSLENKSAKYEKTKDKLKKVIAFLTFMVVFALVVCLSVKSMGGFLGFIEGAFIFYAPLVIAIFGYRANQKKIIVTKDAMTKISDSEELSFIPFSYRNSVNMVGIYMILVDMRADTFKEALNVWEQDKHNMIMEAKPAVMVK
ncbi:MAG: hypothetical protein K2I06_00575 [Ruminococcus sp.]|nr:hypothetical protein [Ruminococcus sp.]